MYGCPGAKYNSPAGEFKWNDESSIGFHAWKKGEARWSMDCAILMNHQNWGTDNCASKRASVCKLELRDYKMPRISKASPSEYKWYVKEWGECSVTCGGGQRHRETFCAGKDDTKKVHYSNCTGTPPDAWKNCNTQPCPSPYKWYAKEWKKCSVTCGGGYQRRELICATKAMLPTAWEMCNHTKTPLWQRRCNTQPCPKQTQKEVPKWKTSAWTRCSVTCGTGRQIRRVVCRAAKSGKVLHNKQCYSLRKPAMVRLCSNDTNCQKRNRHVHCSDNNVMCHFWRKQKLCHGNDYVRRTCKKSCGTCYL